jgi:hypothetical protein
MKEGKIKEAVKYGRSESRCCVNPCGKLLQAYHVSNEGNA